MNLLTDLLRARELVESGRATGAFARYQNQVPCGWGDPNAASFDIAGACHRAVDERLPRTRENTRAYRACLDALEAFTRPHGSVFFFSDFATTSEVLHVFALAIGAARRELAVAA